jgi:hypothetical protein
LTRPVVPPDGSFVFGGYRGRFRLGEIGRPARARAKFWSRNAAMPLHSLTVNKEENPGFIRLSVDVRRLVGSLAGQFESFPQNIPVTLS